MDKIQSHSHSLRRRVKLIIRIRYHFHTHTISFQATKALRKAPVLFIVCAEGLIAPNTVCVVLPGGGADSVDITYARHAAVGGRNLQSKDEYNVAKLR